MNKYMFCILILTLFFLTGCWDRQELNEISITLALGIDKVEDEFLVSAQVVVPSELTMNRGTGSSAVTLYQEKGETIFEAFRKMTKESPRKIYPGHLQILVISEELAQEGIAESLEFLSRDPDLRPDFYVVIAKDVAASEILNITTTLENIPANKMFDSLEMSEKVWAGTRSINLDELITDLISEGKEAVVTGIQLIGNPQKGSNKQNVESIKPAATIQYDDLAVFKRDKLIGWLTEQETIGFSYIKNKVTTSVRPIDCPSDGKATIDIIRSKSNVKGAIKNGEPEVDINVKVEGNVGSVECEIDLEKLETINELEEIFEKELEETIEKTIEASQKKYETDICGFGQAIHRSNPKEWHKIQKNCDEKFPDLTVNINVDFKILHTGSINNSFLEKIND